MHVYLITNMANDKKYVGKANDPDKRWKEHVAKVSFGNQVLYRAMRKYGLNCFSFRVIQSCQSEKDSYFAEAAWIKELNSTIDGWGYNMTLGGDGVLLTESARSSHRILMSTPEVRNAIRQSQILRFQNPEAREKSRQGTLNYFKSEEARLKQSALQKLCKGKPESRLHQSNLMKLRHEDPEFKLKTIGKLQEYWSDPIARQNQSEHLKLYYSKPEIKQKQSQLIKLSWQVPGFRDRMSEAQKHRFSNPEERLKTSISTKKGMSTPETEVRNNLLISSYQSGFTNLRELGLLVGMSYSGVSYVLKQAGVYVSTRKKKSNDP